MKHKIHKYGRVALGKDKQYIIYRCYIPGCKHFMTREMVEGQHAVCWRCEGEFVLTKKRLKLVKPHCKNCTETRGEKSMQTKTEQLLERMGLKIGKK